MWGGWAEEWKSLLRHRTHYVKTYPTSVHQQQPCILSLLHPGICPVVCKNRDRDKETERMRVRVEWEKERDRRTYIETDREGEKGESKDERERETDRQRRWRDRDGDGQRGDWERWGRAWVRENDKERQGSLWVTKKVFSNTFTISGQTGILPTHLSFYKLLKGLKKVSDVWVEVMWPFPREWMIPGD